MPRDLDLRFAIGNDAGIVSSVWRAWKARKSDDIYLTPRAAGHVFKISLHRGDGYCHLAITSEASARAEGRSRVISKWKRDEGPRDGYETAFQLLFPAEYLSRLGSVSEKQTRLIPVPAKGESVVVDVVYSRVPESQMGLAANQILLGRASLASGETVSIIAGTVRDFDAESFQAEFSPIPERTDMAILMESSAPRDSLRGLIFLPFPSGPLRAVEIGPDFNVGVAEVT
jgi:hypothetical protein